MKHRSRISHCKQEGNTANKHKIYREFLSNPIQSNLFGSKKKIES